MSLNLEVKNVAGFIGKKQFIGLKRGLNRIRAPNAFGKTSVIKALELLVLSERELSGRGHYSNLYVGSEEPIVVKLLGEINHERRFRRIGTKDLHLIEGEPLLGYDGAQVLGACFAIPGNRLIDDVLRGEPIREYVRTFAGSENYDKILSALSDISDTISAKLQHYRDALIRLEEMERLKNETEEELEKQRRQLAKMPPLDERTIFEDYELYVKKSQELRNKITEIAQVRSLIAELEDNITWLQEDIKSLENRIQLIKKRHPKMESRLNEIASIIPDKEDELHRIRLQKGKAEDKLASAQQSELFLRKYGEDVCYACGRKMTKAELEAWLAKVRSEIDDLNEAEKKLNRELEDLKEERDRLERNLEELGKAEKELLQKQKSLANRESERRQRIKGLKDLENEHKDLMKEIAELSTSEKTYREFEKRQELLTSIQQREADLMRLQERIKKLQEETLGVEEYQGKYEFVNELTNYLEARKNKLEEEIRLAFNKQVNTLYGKLGFRDFEDIEIGPDFRISVTRRKGGKIVENFPLEALAASERITIAIALLLAAKQTYVKDFPFFVLDELITSYDPARFETIKEYLRKSDDYVILTELSSEAKEVEVVNET
jgi:DNA repair exonuclease SbcCD ATPase subunit